MWPVQLGDLLLEGVDTIETQVVSRDVDLKVSVTDGLEIQGDPEKLGSVFVNLLENAVRYSGPGCSVTVTLARQDPDAE